MVQLFEYTYYQNALSFSLFCFFPAYCITRVLSVAPLSLSLEARAVLPDVDDAVDPQVPLHEVHHHGTSGGRVELHEELQVRRLGLVVHEDVLDLAAERGGLQPRHERVPRLHPVQRAYPEVPAQHPSDRLVVVGQEGLDVAGHHRAQAGLPRGPKAPRPPHGGCRPEDVVVALLLLVVVQAARQQTHALAEELDPFHGRERARGQHEVLAVQPVAVPAAVLLDVPPHRSAQPKVLAPVLHHVLRDGHGVALVHKVVHELEADARVAELGGGLDDRPLPLRHAPGLVQTHVVPQDRAQGIQVPGLRVLREVRDPDVDGRKVPLPQVPQGVALAHDVLVPPRRRRRERSLRCGGGGGGGGERPLCLAASLPRFPLQLLRVAQAPDPVRGVLSAAGRSKGPRRLRVGPPDHLGRRRTRGRRLRLHHRRLRLRLGLALVAKAGGRPPPRQEGLEPVDHRNRDEDRPEGPPFPPLPHALAQRRRDVLLLLDHVLRGPQHSRRRQQHRDRERQREAAEKGGFTSSTSS
mmetsp:Transcript_14064/g.39792  ORF Transcript_14064/g.39792 Transcript_14064/m.39792 type:complete len:523 (+) Transcript_14064:262-1830(+)